MNGQYYCLPPVGHTPPSTQELIKVDQSGMESVSAGSVKKKEKEEIPWQGYHQFPRPPGQAPGVCTAELESSLKNSNT